MKRIRYLSLLVLLWGSIGTKGQSDFNPASPSEPGEPPTKLILVASPSEGGSVYGGGKYAPGTKVSLRASNQTGFVFTKWTNANGDVLSTSNSFNYTKGRGVETLTAHFDFSPGNPGEPTEIAQNVYYWLTLAAEEGGSVSGGGRYKPGTKVTVRATAESKYEFKGWYDAEGLQLSTSISFQYTMPTESQTLTARFSYNPDSPSEPQEPTNKYYLKATTTDGGTVNIGTARLMEGESVTLKATCNEGYTFLGWFVNDVLYTSLKEFVYTMESGDISFEARFEFNPTNPSEPNTPSSKNYSFYMMNKVTKPGTTISFPIYLMSLNELHDMTFQLTFASELHPNISYMQLSAKANGYTISYTHSTDTTYVLSLLGGSISNVNTVLLTIPIPIPTDIATAQGYPIKINQVSVTETDGNTVTASTRNGRISVYKNGDANGDNVVDALDASLILQYVAHKFGDDNPDFIKEAADTNDGDEVDALDASLVLQHAAKKIDLNEINTTE